MDEFTDKGSTDIALINRPKRPGDKTPQQGKKLRRVRVTRNDAGAKNSQPLESEAPHNILFFGHHAGITNPAPGATSGSRKKPESFDACRQAATRKRPDQADFQFPDVLFAPLLTPLADADA
jgi:hypothetical protein